MITEAGGKGIPIKRHIYYARWMPCPIQNPGDTKKGAGVLVKRMKLVSSAESVSIAFLGVILFSFKLSSLDLIESLAVLQEVLILFRFNFVNDGGEFWQCHWGSTFSFHSVDTKSSDATATLLFALHSEGIPRIGLKYCQHLGIDFHRVFLYSLLRLLEGILVFLKCAFEKCWLDRVDNTK
jgi:hypothetical protein